MKARSLSAIFFALILSLGWSGAWADDLPENVTFTTKIITPLAIEGLTGDNRGNLYTTGRAASPTGCPVWRINIDNPSLDQIGSIPNPTSCNPSGIAFDHDGNLYIADAALGGVIWKLTRNNDGTFTSPATAFASGVPGTNGIAFGRDGNLWTGDGTTGQGRVWKITPAGGVTEEFRVQPMANEVNLVSGVGGVGRDIRTLPPGTITVTATSRNAANTLGSQPLVVNGLAFNEDGDRLFISDTARGAIWRVKFDYHGNLESPTNCDTTFIPPSDPNRKVLCLENIFVAHPLLEGTDGIALDKDGNIWNSANERNAIVVVTKERKVVEVFRNPVNTNTNLRNSATNLADNNRILELPASPFLSRKIFCTSNSDGDRRDNSPRNAGEINAGGLVVGARGKISCMDQELIIQGLPLPVD